MGMIVVTGGAGFIGSAVVWGLNGRQIEDILVVDELDRTEKWKNLAALRFADYLDKGDFLIQLEKGRFDRQVEGIVHLGACSSTTETDLGYLMKNNYEYTRRLAQWCLRGNKRFVYASSAATYGDGSRGFSDRHKHLELLRPLNGYGFSKHAFDLWCKRHKYLKRLAGLKYFNVFGANEYHKEAMRSVVHKAFGQIQAEGTVRLFKSHRADYQDGRQLRDFVYVKDAVAATLAIYENKKANGIFNVGTGRARSFLDLVTAVFGALEREPQIEYIDMPEEIRDRYQYYTEAQVTKLHKVWPGPFHSLEDAITDYVQKYLLADDPYLQ